MKKVKIMLTVIVVLAIAGGALAFKTKTFNQAFCTIIPDEPLTSFTQTSFCPNLIVDKKLVINPPTPLVYATTLPAGATTCTSAARPNGFNCIATVTEDDGE